MTPEELMKPRYKVIADYPGSEQIYRVGEIIIPTWEGHNSELSKYPHLFQPLPWYAERKPEDMPEYVEYDGQVLKVEKWIVENGTVFISLPMPYPAFTIGNKHYKIPTPATHEQYINSNKQP